MSINVNDKNIGHATAYAYYKAGGGTMTEAEFTEFMADFGTASQTAVEAAQAALASKNAAQTAATTATTKASEATTAAQTATTKAGEASTSASTATSAKDTAVSASQTATTKASEATTAAATATNAASTATTAKDDAVSAKTAAQTAQTGAETAAASVSASAEQIATNTSDISELKEDLIKLANYDVGDIPIENLSNGYISTSGDLTNDGICKTTDYFVFTEGMTVISLLHCATGDASWCAISYYDKDKNFLSRTVYAGSATRTGQACILKAISGSSYARVSFRTYTGWTIQLKYLKTPINRLSPKKIDRIEFVQGGLNGIEYNTYQPQRVATLETARYDKDIVVYLPKGHKMAYRSVVNGAQGFDSGWKFGFMYIPAGTDFLMLLAKETEDTNVADVAEFTSGMMIRDKYSENPTFVHGSLSSGEYTTNDKRIVNVSYFKFDKMVKITPRSGYSVSITEYRNDTFFYDYYWRDIFYMPAGATFRLVVKKNDDSIVQLSDKCFDIEPCDEESVYSNLNGVNHRGFWTAPENTIPAFSLSKENGFHFVETDIALTSDGVPVLLHDETINRTARNLDYSAISNTINIADITYESALGYTFNGGLGWYRQYIKIPTLYEFLAYCKLNSIHAYLELKTAAAYTDAQLQNIVDIVKMRAMWDSVTWISFNTSYLSKVKAIDASARLGYIVTSFSSSDISFVQGLGDNSFIDAQHEYITDELAQSCANAGVRLEAWSTNDVKLSELNKYVSRFTNNRWHN